MTRLEEQLPTGGEWLPALETALEKNRNRRYQTALALAEDLARIRKHEPIKAQQLIRKWRKPAPPEDPKPS